MKDKFILSNWRDLKLQWKSWAIIVPVYAFLLFESATTARLSHPLEIAVYKLLVSLLAVCTIWVILLAVYLCVLSPLGAPSAMYEVDGILFSRQLKVAFSSIIPVLMAILVDFSTYLFVSVYTTITDPFNRFDQYPPQVVPYRLYPLSCILLE
jgi:hypothetical protein